MIENRKLNRSHTDLTVMLTTVLDMREGRIIDLSETGAQIVGASFATDTHLQIDHHGQTLYAKVMWHEVDRMGVRFAYPLTDGPLHDELCRMHLATQRARSYIGPSLALSRNQPARFGRRAAA